MSVGSTHIITTGSKRTSSALLWYSCEFLQNRWTNLKCLLCWISLCVCPLPAELEILTEVKTVQNRIRPRPLLFSHWTKRYFSRCYPEPRRWLAGLGCQSWTFFAPFVLMALFYTWQRNPHMDLCFDFRMEDGETTTEQLCSNVFKNVNIEFYVAIVLLF